VNGHVVIILVVGAGVVGGGEEEVDECPVCAAGVDDKCFGVLRELI